VSSRSTVNSDLPISVNYLEIKFVSVSSHTPVPPFTSTDLPEALTLQDFTYGQMQIGFGLSSGGTITGLITSLEPPEPPDTDSDGVPDLTDECPDTPEGAIVYSNGCMKGDTDKDGDVDGDDLSIFSKNFGL
jgi:hypothetical protein